MPVRIMKDIILKICSDRHFVLTGSVAFALQGLLTRKPKDLDFVTDYNCKAVKLIVNKLFPDAIFLGSGNWVSPTIAFNINGIGVDFIFDRVLKASLIKYEATYIHVMDIKRHIEIKKRYKREKDLIDLGVLK